MNDLLEFLTDVPAPSAAAAAAAAASHDHDASETTTKTKKRGQKLLFSDNDDSDDDIACAWFADSQPNFVMKPKKRRIMNMDSDDDDDDDDDGAGADDAPPCPVVDTVEDDDLLDELLGMGQASPPVLSPAPTNATLMAELFGDDSSSGADAHEDDVPAPESGGEDFDEDSDDGYPGAARIPEAEEMPSGGSSGGGGEDGSRVIIAKPLRLKSLYPPVLVVKCGKTAATSFTLDLCGDLVRDVSSPLFRFQLRVHPSSADDVNSPNVIDEIVKVMDGPCIDAEKKALAIQASRDLTNTVKPVPIVTLGAVRGVFSRSEYFDEPVRRKVSTNVAQAIAGSIPGTRGTPSRLVVPREILEKHAPYDGTSKTAWCLRNAHEQPDFFSRANYVGGKGVHALCKLSGDQDALWKIAQGLPGGLIDEPSIDGPEVTRILETVLFANKLDTSRTRRLTDNLNVHMSAEVRVYTEVIQKAADIFHRLPRHGTSSSTEGIVWGEAGDPWPHAMRTLLIKHGVHVQQRDGNRWYACWNEARSYYASISDDLGDNIYYVRAEADDDHDDPTEGYIAKLSKIVEEHAPHIVLLTSTARAHYLKEHAGFEKIWRVQLYHHMSVVESSVVVVDRAHQIPRETLKNLIKFLSEHDKVEKIYLCGALFPAIDKGVTSLFAQLYEHADTAKRIVCNTALLTHKVADGRDPTTEASRAEMPHGTAIFVLSGITRPTVASNTTNVISPDLAKAFPNVIVTTPRLHATNTGWTPVSAAIVLLTPNWTRDDLAIVWQCTINTENAIWFCGPVAGMWKGILSRGGRKRPSAGAALL